MTPSLPLRERKIDIAFLTFFIFNLVFITYFFDLEQIVIPDTSHFTYPPWPPAFLVRLSHWWGQHYDPLLYARPVWWRATIWIDVLLFGPYYIAAIYAFLKGKNWIRMPSIVYASIMLTNVTIILCEEIWGAHAAGNVCIVLAANASWILFPVLLLLRMWKSDKPFDKKS